MWQSLQTIFKRDKKIFAFLLLYYVFIISITPLASQADISWDFIRWISTMVHDGVHTIYKNPMINYPPISLYTMYSYGMLLKVLEIKLEDALYSFKDFVFLFDLGMLYIVIKIMERFKIEMYKIIFFVFNIAFLYNTVFWGQIDSIYTFFVLASVYCALTKRSLWSVALYVCALFSKPQAVIFFPVIVMLLLPYVYKNRTLLYKAPLVALGTLILIFYPFIVNGTALDYLTIIKKTTDYFPYVAFGAFNLWGLIFGIARSSHIHDSGMLMGLAFRTWGTIFFALAAFVVLQPLYRVVRPKFDSLKHYSIHDWKIVFLSLSLLTTAFFFFNTEMHERYVHSAIVFSGIFGLLSGRYALYIIVSLAYIANMTAIFSALAFNPSKIIKPELAAVLFAVALGYGIYELYHKRHQAPLDK